MEVQREGEAERVELTGGGELVREKEIVSKIVPATQRPEQLTLKDRQTWLETNWRREQGASEENNRRSAASLGHLIFPSIYGNRWIIYKPLPLALCYCVCQRERERERERGGFAELTTTMLCPAAVSAAAIWLLAVLGPGLSLSAEDNAEQGFTLCSDCFYRQTPPRGASAELLLHPLCHTLPGGQAFATLSKPACDTAVYSAFHLRHGWTEEEEGEELLVRTRLKWYCVFFE